jgi:LacI family transcriptional regulator
VRTPILAKGIIESGLPTVALDSYGEKTVQSILPTDLLPCFGEITADSHRAAQMAAEHLLDRGFQHYAFVGLNRAIISERRKDSFTKRVEAAGFTTHIYKPPRLKRDRVWEREQKHLAEWLDSLPKPVGLMAANDDRGREVLEACLSAEIRVPEQLAVIGVDNDELLCDLADPPLSSVALNTEQGGFRMAALLDKMMRGQVKEPQHLTVEAQYVVTRRSTDIVAIDDSEVAGALRFIRDKYMTPIGAKDVVSNMNISRRTLEVRFQKAVGRTIHAEIQRMRLEHVKRLLEETDYTTEKIAFKTGFTCPIYMRKAFKKNIGLTPAKYRAKSRFSMQE